jgi:hypothetical protein
VGDWMTDCIHPFIERATKLQNGECYSCLRARLEEAERERDEWQGRALRAESIDSMDLEVAIARAEAAERERDNKAEALEALARRLEEAVHELEDMGAGSAPMRYGIVNGSALRKPPAEPVRTPEAVQTSWDRLSAWLQKETGEGLGPVTFVRCDRCGEIGPRSLVKLDSASGINMHEPLCPEPVRTEGAPKQCESRSRSDACALRRGHPGRHQVESGAVTWDDSCAEGAPKQGPQNDFIGPCAHGRDPFDRCDQEDDPEGGGCGELEPWQAEILALRASLSQAEARARAAVLSVFDNQKRAVSKGGAPYGDAFLCAALLESVSAALAPEAPVEKDGGA